MNYIILPSTVSTASSANCTWTFTLSVAPKRAPWWRRILRRIL